MEFEHMIEVKMEGNGEKNNLLSSFLGTNI